MSNIRNVQAVHTWLHAISTLLEPPHDLTQLNNWIDAAEDLAETMLDEGEQINGSASIIESCRVNFIKEFEASSITSATVEKMDELCTRLQIEQRTPEWYDQIKNVLGASELYDIYAAPRTRAMLVMSKVNPPQRPTQSLAVHSSRMSAFDWGIRFEPVVKQIYTLKYNAIIKELGRLISAQNSRISASPDGLVYSGPKQGRLLEIKCPVTREPDGIISKKYYHQMQSQLFVSGLSACDFVEAVFTSPYSTSIERCGPGEYCGEILLVESIASYYYIYGPVNHIGDFTPELPESDTIVERIPWSLYSWHEQVVRADPKWWTDVQPAVDLFWADVEKAKRGEFIVPDKMIRASKKSNCLIVIKEDNAMIEAN